MKSVNEVSKLSGVSRRTLQYYDEIGLLPPEIRELMESAFFLPLVKSGIFPGSVSIVKNAANIMNLDFGKLLALCRDVIQKFCEAMQDGPDSLAAKEAVASYKEFINSWIPCDDQAFRKLDRRI